MVLEQISKDPDRSRATRNRPPQEAFAEILGQEENPAWQWPARLVADQMDQERRMRSVNTRTPPMSNVTAPAMELGSISGVLLPACAACGMAIKKVTIIESVEMMRARRAGDRLASPRLFRLSFIDIDSLVEIGGSFCREGEHTSLDQCRLFVTRSIQGCQTIESDGE